MARDGGQNGEVTAAVDWTEPERLAALERYAILDTPREPQFDDVVHLAADIFGAPIAVVNLIASGRQWFKAEVGIGADELPLDVSICAHAILQRGLFIVPDTTQDERFACNPLVTGEPRLRFYAGALLETPDGLPLGTLCVLDTQPRPEGITPRQRMTLEVLARQVVTQLELRRALAERDQRARQLEAAVSETVEANRVLHETDRRLNAVLDNTRMAVFQMDHQQHCVYANAAAEQLTGYTLAQMQGRPLHDVVHHKYPDGSHYPLEECPIDRAFPERAQMSGEELFVAPDGSFYPVAFTASPILNDAGKPVGTVIEARNIAEEKAARERLMQLAAIAEQSRDFIGIADADAGLVFVNEAGLRMMGLPNLDAACAVPLLDYFAPSCRQLIAEQALSAAERDNYWEGEVTLRRVDSGVEFPVLYNLFPIRDAEGRLTHYATVTRDLSEKRAADAALRSSEAYLRLLLDSTSEAFYAIDNAGVLTMCNRAFLQMLGFADEAQIVGRNIHEVIHHSHADGTVYTREDCPIARCARLGKPVHVSDEFFYRADGERFPVEYRASPIYAEGTLKGAICTFSDISERREAEQAILEAQELYRLAARATNDAIWDWHFATNDVLWNDALQAAYGWAPELVEPTGEWWLEQIHPDDRQRIDDSIHRAIDGTAESWTDEYRFKCADGSYTSVFDRGHIIRDADGVAVRMIGAMLDLTDRRRAEDALRELNERLEQRVAEAIAEREQVEEALRQAQKMEAVGQLTGGIAHDFNNMLAVVLGSLDLLRRRLGAADTRTLRYLDAASDGARRATLLTQRLLAFSRQQPLRPEAINANRLVAGMSDILRHSLGGDIRLETVLAGGLWRAEADPHQLENVILNLAINARDAMPDGGWLTIETANCHLDDRYVSSHIGITAGQYVMIAVTDTGVGMAPEVVAKAFDPFFTTKAVGKGTGLGLSQVYGFVRQSGGHVKIYSEVGQGTTIKVYLPRLVGPDEELEAEPLLLDTPLGEHMELILVVEDEPAVRQFSVDALTELGYRVLEADGAASALRLLEMHRDISLLFTDVVMPETNGAKLAEHARRLRADLRVLFTTGYTRNAVVHNGVLDPGVDLIGKPYSIEELAAKVRDVLDAPVLS